MSEVMEKPEVKPAKKGLKMYKVVIHTGEDAGDKGDVVLVHNYHQIVIQRDKEVTISENYLEVLKHSVVDTVKKGEDGKEMPVRIPRYSYLVEAA